MTVAAYHNDSDRKKPDGRIFLSPEAFMEAGLAAGEAVLVRTIPHAIEKATVNIPSQQSRENLLQLP